MKFYECYGTALVLTGEEVDEFATAYGKETGMERENILQSGEELASPGGVFALTSLDEAITEIEFYRWAEGERECLDGVGWNYNRWANSKIEHLDDSDWIVYAEKQMLGQNMFLPAPYASLEELADEFRRKLGPYLPNGFEFEKKIGFVAYAER